MTKDKKQNHSWIDNLRSLMNDKGLNPRSLSLKAGLNQTAVRDMLEGRVKFPRYDTANALANALDVSASKLMGGAEEKAANIVDAPSFAENLDLLTEILIRLQEIAGEMEQHLLPNEYAAMAASIFKQMKDGANKKNDRSQIPDRIYSLIDYENFRRKNAR